MGFKSFKLFKSFKSLLTVERLERLERFERSVVNSVRGRGFGNAEKADGGGLLRFRSGVDVHGSGMGAEGAPRGAWIRSLSGDAELAAGVGRRDRCLAGSEKSCPRYPDRSGGSLVLSGALFFGAGRGET